MTNHNYNAGGTPPKASQRGRNVPARILMAEPMFKVGDKVRWAGRYSGRVIVIDKNEAVISEQDRSVRWKLGFDKLTRA